MRLFYGLRFRDSALGQVVEQQRDLEARFPGARGTRRENLHLTLAFLGEVSLERVPALRRLVAETPPTAIPETLRFPGFTAFPSRSRQIVCLEAEGDRRLTELQGDLCRRVRVLGFSLEDRPYRPHMTLARHCPKGELPDLPEPVDLPVEGMALYWSRREAGALTYTPLILKNVP